MVRVDFNHVIRISLSVDIPVPDAYLRAEKDCLKGNEDLMEEFCFNSPKKMEH